MRILFTGASSCTGMHFVKELAKHHTVFCTFTKSLPEYSDIQKQRIENILPDIIPVWNTRFGSSKFIDLLQHHSFDTYAHHMSWTKGYGTNDYPIEQAVQNNTYNIESVTQRLTERGCTQIILTCSIFEGRYADIHGGKAPFESHGIAKKRSTDLFLSQRSPPVRLFCIPNPVGTFDNHRLVESLHQQWLQQQVPHILYPDNIRDNIPIPFLTTRYKQFFTENTAYASPSGWRESNADFVERVARELSQRFSYETPIQLGPQKDRHQPLLLCNREPLLQNETFSSFWDELSEHYKHRFSCL